MKKPILLSGITPSGAMHIGNYLGAISQWVEMQSTHSVFVMIADLHAITVPQEPAALRENTLRMARLLIACGIDPAQSVLFVQSHVPAHAELAWILNTITPLGELERMTQFKDKGKIKSTYMDDVIKSFKKGLAIYKREQKEENLEKKVEFLDQIIEKNLDAFDALSDTDFLRQKTLAGLLNYPVLMAADILLYQTDAVPVGEDQQQHLELTRTLANKFNNRFGDTFTIPQALIPKDTARIMGLDDPTKKMSKSAASANNYISLLDEPDEIRRKIKIAVTDSGSEIIYDEEQKPAIANLMRIYRAFSGESLKEIEFRYAGKGYADFKRDLAELLVQKLSSIQEKYRLLSSDEKSIKAILADGAKTAHIVAQKTLHDAYEKVGFLPDLQKFP